MQNQVRPATIANNTTVPATVAAITIVLVFDDEESGEVSDSVWLEESVGPLVGLCTVYEGLTVMTVEIKAVVNDGDSVGS